MIKIILLLTFVTLPVSAYIVTPGFIEIIKEVEIVTGGDCHGFDGSHVQHKGEITIHLCDMSIDILTHEIGHEVWFNKMTEKERQVWQVLFEHSKEHRDYAREYGKTNVKEDFSTVFEAYYVQKLPHSRTKMMKHKIRFIVILDDKYMQGQK